MKPSLAAAVLGLVALLLAGALGFAIRRRGPARRPVLLVLVLLGAAPVLVVLLAWARVFDVPYVRFEHPWLTLPAALLVGWVGLRLSTLSARLAPPRRLLIELATSAGTLAAALSSIGVELGRPLDRMTVVVAIDRSRSIDLVPRAQDRIQAELRVAELGMREEDRIAVVAFGASAAVEEPARPRSRLASPQRAEVPRDGTDIAAGLRLALAELPPDSGARIALVSDGVATRGDTTEAALAATALGIAVDSVALDQGRITDVRLVSVHVPPRAAEGETLDLRVVTESSSATAVEVRVYRDGELVRRGPTQIGKGEDVLYLRELAPGPGLHRYDVELSAADPSADRLPDDNAGSAFLRVRGPSTALVLDGDPTLGTAMGHALRDAAFQVDVAGLDGVPAELGGLARYDLVVLGDISATELSRNQLEAFRSYVRDLGGGLLLMGGDRTMGPGGYARTPIEDISPLSFDLKQERRRASLAEVIAVDYSGSMAMSVGGKTKLDLANEAAARSADLLGAGDRLGVLHVDTAVQWTVPLAAIDDKAEIEARIRRVAPGGGGIFVDLAISAAHQALRRENVQLKHLLLFSDGSDAEERTQAFALVLQGKRAGITTSVVALGNGGDVPALSRMAELGGGRFYLIEDATRLPAVFAQETILATRSAINEVRFVPRATTPSQVLRGVDLSAAPALGGYVVTIAKPRAQLLLVGPESDPILATWSAGVGRAGAFTSDYKDRWGRAWTGWDGASRLFGQLGRDLSRRLDDPNVRWEAEAATGELSVRATVFDDRGRRETLRRLRARVAGPEGFSREVLLEAVGAGSFVAKVPLSRPGAYLATLVDDERDLALATTGAALSAGEELRPSGTDRGELARIAGLTGGKMRDTLAGIFNDRARRFAYSSVNDWLATLAAACLLLSVASRRLALPSWTLKRAHGRARARTSVTEIAANGNATLSALRQKRERTQAFREPRPDAGRSAPLSAPSTDVREPASPEPEPSRPLEPPATTPGPRVKTAAEILLERRRSRGKQ